MKKSLFFSFILLGFSSIIGQAIILREIIVSFYGNEFFIGIILASWLIWVALGSYFGGKILAQENKTINLYLFSHLLLALFFFLEIILIRFLRIFGVAGAIPNLLPSLFLALIIPTPLCLILGFQFSLGAKFFSQKFQKTLSFSLSQFYLLESLGFVIGGIGFSFLLVFLNEFLVAGIFACLNLLAAIFILIYLEKRYLFKFIFVLVLLAFIISFLYSSQLNQTTAGFRSKNQKLIESKNSSYGNIAVTQTDSQYNFYESGLLLGSNKETQFNESLIHLSLLQHPKPKSVLLIGGGFNGAINEILKHPVEKLVYLELDSEIIKTTQKYLAEEIKKAFDDLRIEIINTDARWFIKNTSQKFDFILINLPDPSTALINRFYTQEFFQEIKEKLNQKGVVTTYLSFSPDYQNQQMENLNASLYKTLSSVFEEIIILPEYINLFLASDNQKLTYEPETIIQRFQDREIQTEFLTIGEIQYRLTTDRINTAIKSFQENKEVKINHDFKPISYYYNISYWLTYFRPGLTKGLGIFNQTMVWLILAVILLILLAFSLLKKGANLLSLNMAGVGFTLMGAEIIFILGYQVLYGYLYWQIAVLISLLMAGMALGTWWGKKNINRTKKILPRVHLGLIILSLLTILEFKILSNIPQLVSQIILFLSLIVFGILAGMAFPIICELYFSPAARSAAGENNRTTIKEKSVGSIYAADLVGSALGAILPALILIPILGITQTLVFLVLINWLMIIGIKKRAF